MTGPVQVLVVGFDQPTFSGEVLAEFARLQELGIVRLVDLLLVSRAEDGTLEILSDQLSAGSGRIGAGLLSEVGDEAGDPAASAEETSTWSLDAAVPPGSSAAVALIEHTWAAPLRAAISNNGGRPLDETWLSQADLDRLDALLAEES
jgi:hypothetical protein